MLRVMMNNVIKKELRSNVFSLPFSWSLQDKISRSLSDDVSTSKTTITNQVNSSSNKDDTKIEANPYYSKYADKIKKAVNEQGIAITDQIEENLKKIEALNTIPESERIKTKTSKDSKTKEIGPKIGGFPGNKTLKDIVNLDMLLRLDSDNIGQVWSEYHRVKSNCVYAVIPAEKYKQMYETGKQYPTFIFPVPTAEKSDDDKSEKSGYQIFLGQFNYHQIHFAPLIQYQLHKENAPAVMTLRHYPEISEEKGIVLMEGFFDDKILNSMEAQCLANQVKIFYGVNDLPKNLLLHKFNKDPKSFDYQEVIDQFEKGLL